MKKKAVKKKTVKTSKKSDAVKKTPAEPKKKVINNDGYICPICNSDIDIAANMLDEPWHDGICYGIICHCCAGTIKQWEIINDKWIECTTPKLRTVDDMLKQGYKKDRATLSLAAVKEKLKGNK